MSHKQSREMRRREVAVVIPTLNEQETIETVLNRLLELEEIERVIVVDGGSVDATAEIAEALGASVIMKDGVGYGAAIREGLKLASLKDADIVVVIDGDASYNPEDIPKLLQVLDSDKTIGLAVGSRPERSFETKFFNLIFRLLFGTRLTDVSSSLIAARGKAIKEYDFRSEGFWLPIEMKAKTTREGMKIVEVPITYRRIRGRRPWMIVWLEGFRLFREMLRMWFRF